MTTPPPTTPTGPAGPAAGPRTVAFVLPVLDEAGSLGPLHEALTAMARGRPDLAFEFLFVDDGSRDRSLETLLDLRETDPRVAVVGLSRNVGHQAALTAGLDACAAADAVVVMDADLQDPPRVALELITRRDQGADVVYAQRRSRRDPLFKRGTAYAFYWLLARVASVGIPRDTGDFRLLDARVVREVARYREHDRFLRGIVAHVGFRQEALLFDRDERPARHSHYPLRRMLSLVASGPVGFSTAPLRWISRLGFAISAISLLLAGYVAYLRVFVPEQAVPGWAFLGVGMFLLSGLQLVMMGVIGTYLGRVYDETRGRPLYSVALTARGLAGPGTRATARPGRPAEAQLRPAALRSRRSSLGSEKTSDSSALCTARASG